MQIFLGCDHAGINEKNALKEYFLKNDNYEVIDCGINEGEKIDYPNIAQEVSDNVLKNKNSIGFLICGTGIGVSIKANRNKGIRAALVYNDFTAQMAKQHNNANIVCFGARTTSIEDILNYAKTFINTDYNGLSDEGKRHANRIKLLDEGIK